jgi:hypothetical protein
MAAVYRTIFHDLSGPLTLKLDVLLTWAVTPDRVAAYRRQSVASLLRRHISDPESDCFDLQDSLIEWIDANQDLDEPAERSRVASLFAELMRTGVFSYSRYLQRLIASGETSIVAPQVSRGVLLNMHDEGLTCLCFSARDAPSLFVALPAGVSGASGCSVPE